MYRLRKIIVLLIYYIVSSFTNVTNEYIASLSLEDRKKHGQYMTPSFLAKKMVFYLKPYVEELSKKQNVLNILDPAVGTGELLKTFNDTFPTISKKFYGFDIDKGMLEAAKKNVKGLNAYKKSIFDKNTTFYNNMDIIIGNPPYYEIKKNMPELSKLDFETKNESGRLNMFSLFFEYAATLLKPEGVMVYIVPPSMNNGAYFKKLRNFIIKNFTIEHIEIIRDNKHFKDALTSIQIIVLKKKQQPKIIEEEIQNSNFIIDFNKITNKDNSILLPTIFTDNAKAIKKAWKGKQSLIDAGYVVKTGNVPWNQYKSYFQTSMTNNSNYAPLLYSKDIINNTILYDINLEDKRWLPVTNKVMKEPSIIVNRIVGSLNNPKIKYALVDLPEYYTENHVNVITFPNISNKESLKMLNKLLIELNGSHKWLKTYLQSITGNTQISATELAYLIPLVKNDFF